MPIYAYTCSHCGKETEALQKISDAPLTDCPHCGRPSLVKKVTAAGFQLKGSGWYATDFKDKPAAKKVDGTAESKTEAGGKAEPKSEKKASGETGAAPSTSTAPAPSPTPSGGGSGT